MSAIKNYSELSIHEKITAKQRTADLQTIVRNCKMSVTLMFVKNGWGYYPREYKS